jgi:hypothetical protein
MYNATPVRFSWYIYIIFKYSICVSQCKINAYNACGMKLMPKSAPARSGRAPSASSSLRRGARRRGVAGAPHTLMHWQWQHEACLPVILAAIRLLKTKLPGFSHALPKSRLTRLTAPPSSRWEQASPAGADQEIMATAWDCFDAHDTNQARFQLSAPRLLR